MDINSILDDINKINAFMDNRSIEDIIKSFVDKNLINNHSVKLGFLKFPVKDNYHVLYNNQDRYRDIEYNGRYKELDDILTYYKVNMDQDYPIDFFVNNRIHYADIEDDHVLISVDQIKDSYSQYIK